MSNAAHQESNGILCFAKILQTVTTFSEIVHLKRGLHKQIISKKELIRSNLHGMFFAFTLFCRYYISTLTRSANDHS